MFSISQKNGDVIAADTRSAITQVEDALLMTATQISTTVQVMRAVNLPVNVKRKLYGSMTATAAKIVEVQQEQDQTLRILHLINKHNSTPVEMFGCPLGWPPSISLDQDETAIVDDKVLARQA